MMAGKAVARSVRGHILTQSALYVLLLILLNCDQQHGSSQSCEEQLTRLHEMYDGIASSQYSLADREGLDVQFITSLPTALDEKLKGLQNMLSETSRTAKLLIRYIYYVSVLLDFIRAERTSNWNAHLLAVSKMLNIFAAAGHRHYAKSGRLYLQLMIDLPNSYPWLHAQFCQNGMHAVRRTARFWGGLWTDLVIKQVLMASIKSPGGLTHGRGMSESVRIVCGLPCLAACKHCNGEVCKNAHVRMPDEALTSPDELGLVTKDDLNQHDDFSANWLRFDIDWIDEEVVE